MQAVQLFLPAIATAALGTALLVPIRDDRHGRRATIGSGYGPFRPDFSSTRMAAPIKPAAASETPAHVNDVRVDDVRVDDVRVDDECLDDGCVQDVDMNDVRVDDVRDAGERADEERTDDERADDARLDDGPAECGASYSLRECEDSRDVADVGRRGSSVVAPSEVARFASALTEAVQARTLLEPGDFLMAIGRPFSRVRAAIIRFANLAILRGETLSPQASPVEDPTATSIFERSFAIGPASLLRAPAKVVERSEASSEASPSHDERATSPAPSRLDTEAMPDRLVGVASAFDAPAEESMALQKPPAASARFEKPVVGDALRDGASEHDAPEPENSDRETRDGVRFNDGDDDALSFDNAWKPGPPQTRDATRSDGRSEQNIVVAPAPARPERAVPITRLPLRPQGIDITWTAEIPDPEQAAPLSRATRHRLLERFVRNPGTVPGEVIARAYHQEEGDGRQIALRILLRHFPQAGRSAFIEALRVGSDEERALAVDGLTAIGARSEMTPAFSDRVDAIAAKAALAYVGTLERAHYRAELSRFIDETQIEAILTLLAGLVE